MIERLRIRCFQAHRKRQIVFDPLVTTIVGANDVGKSAILRALYWLCFNQPSGTEFLSWGESQVSAELLVDGHILRRVRSSSTNHYELDGQRFAAIGQGPPPEPVQRLLSAGPLNFQRQLDGPFWFCETPGEVSRQLNQIVDLAMVDAILGAGAARVRSPRSEISVSERRLATAKEQQRELAWVEQFDADLSRVESIYEQFDQVTTKASELASLLEQGESIRQTAENASGAKLDALPAMRIGEELLQVTQQIDKLGSLLKQIQKGEESVCQAARDIATSSAAILRVVTGKVCPVCKGSIDAKRLMTS